MGAREMEPASAAESALQAAEGEREGANYSSGSNARSRFGRGATGGRMRFWSRCTMMLCIRQDVWPAQFIAGIVNTNSQHLRRRNCVTHGAKCLAHLLALPPNHLQCCRKFIAGQDNDGHKRVATFARSRPPDGRPPEFGPEKSHSATKNSVSSSLLGGSDGFSHWTNDFTGFYLGEARQRNARQCQTSNLKSDSRIAGSVPSACGQPIELASANSA